MTKLKKVDPIGLTDCFIAGGSVLSLVTKSEISDYDIYPKSEEGFIEVVETLFDNNCFVVCVSDRAVTFKCNDIKDSTGERMIFQVMTFDYFPDAQSIFKNFDFTVCMAAFDCDTEEYFFDDMFWQDVASKSLRFNSGTKYPLNSLIRTYKYKQKGYQCGKAELAKIALTVAEKGMPKSWEELENEIGGTYGKSLSLAREGVDFTFGNAIQALCDMEEGSFELLDNSDNVPQTVDELLLILGKYEKQLYEFGFDYYTVDEGGFVSLFASNLDPEDFNVDVKPLTDLEYISTYKELKITATGGEFKGAIYGGNHNGVVYNPFCKTEYNTSPFLYSYVDEISLDKRNCWSVVKVPTKDIVGIDKYKVQSKSIIVGEIKGSK